MNPTPLLAEHPAETMRLLVVSRETVALRPLWSMAESNAWQMETAASPWEALERVQSGLAPHLLILDLARGDGESLHILRWLRRLRPELPTLLLCHASDADKQRDAIRMGANEVLVRPFLDESLQVAICRYLTRTHDGQGPDATGETVEPLGEGRFFVTASPIMHNLRLQAEMLAQTDVPVLVLGEKGSGKETIARLIHQLSVRSGFRFMKVNCADTAADLLEKEPFRPDPAVPSSQHGLPVKFQAAEKGTVFFDEITEMPDHLQGRLLDALQDHNPTGTGQPTNGLGVRVLASTSANLERALAEHTLREDLYYRLSAFTIHVPPLRQRKKAIRVLLQHCMHGMARHYGLPPREFSSAVLESCGRYWWPGNVDELETFVKRYLVAGESDLVLNNLDPRHHERINAHGNSALPPDLDSSGPENGETKSKSLKALIQDIKCETERNAIGLALEKTGWNRKAAARLLKVSYRTLLYKIEQYQMKATESGLSQLSSSPFGSKDN